MPAAGRQKGGNGGHVENKPVITKETANLLLKKAGDLVLLSLLWSVCSVPVVTLGASAVALYDCVLYAVRGGDDEQPVWKRFFRIFKRDFARATGMTVLCLIFFFSLFLIDILFMAIVSTYPEERALPILHLVYRALMLLPACAACWLFPLIDRFKLTRRMLRVTAWKLTFQQMAPSAVMVLIVVLAGIACMRLYLIPLIILPGLVALILSYIMEYIFTKYEVSGTPEDDAPASAPDEAPDDAAANAPDEEPEKPAGE